MTTTYEYEYDEQGRIKKMTVRFEPDPVPTYPIPYYIPTYPVQPPYYYQVWCDSGTGGKQ